MDTEVKFPVLFKLENDVTVDVGNAYVNMIHNTMAYWFSIFM